MIDITTVEGMEKILELRKTKKIQQIIDEYGIKTGCAALAHRIRRYKENGITTHKRSKLDRAVLIELAAKGLCQKEAAEIIGCEPMRISRCAKKLGIVFRNGRTKDGLPIKLRGAASPTLSQEMPTEIRELLQGPWVSKHIAV